MANLQAKESSGALLAEIVDYAGLFPPAGLPMTEAVANYAAYKNGEYSWMLGRFIVPVARLEEFADDAKKLFEQSDEIWKISVLAGEDIYGTVSEVEKFNCRYAPFAVCDALEVKAETGARIEQINESIPPELDTYFEIPIGENLADSVATLAICGRRAKIRTGGVVQSAFPQTERITRFIKTCLAANVPFKATAGLHHPFRCTKPLTYEKNASAGAMHGFLNVFLAAAFLMNGVKTNVVDEIMEDGAAENFHFTDNGVLWRREHFVGTALLKNLREKCVVSFGSCSFDEPIADLREIGIL